MYCQRGLIDVSFSIKVFFEIIVGEVVVESPYKVLETVDGIRRKRLGGGDIVVSDLVQRRLSGYLAQRVPSLFLAGSLRNCSNCAVLKGMFPWRTRYPSS